MMCRGEQFDRETSASIEWGEGYFYCCEFEKFSVEGGHIDSDFTLCRFTGLDWYWGLFNISSFIDCKFTDCVFRGCTLADCRFVECELTRCRFVKDNLGRDCVFPQTMTYGCVFQDCEGFKPTVKGDAANAAHDILNGPR